MARGTSGKTVAVIGAGHMGRALVQGLRAYTRSRVLVSDSSRDNARVAREASVVFLAVKPSVVRTVLNDIKTVVDGKLIVSLAAGVSTRAMREAAGARVSIARIMPNIPVAHGEGVIGLYALNVSKSERMILRMMLKPLGLLIEVKRESTLDALTLIAGCGPGIVAELMNVLANRAHALGLARADEVALQTFTGSIHHMTQAMISARRLIKEVATKGGVTEAILEGLRKEKIEERFARALERGLKKLRSIRA